MFRLGAALSLMFVALTRIAGAQQPPAEDPVAEAPIRLGVIGLAPRVAITNIGVDTNVFNTTAETPERDFTFTASPGLDLWLRTRRGLLTLNGRTDLVYFHEFASERSVSGTGKALYEYRFNRVRPFVAFEAMTTRERPGYEIDARARRFENTLRLGVDLRVASKSYVEFAARRQNVDFAADAVFKGTSLGLRLDRVLEAVDLTWRQRLTVLTTWIVRGGAERERFKSETSRNSDSVRVNTGFELGRFALIRGTAFVGYRRLVGADGGLLPEYSGMTANVNVAYTAPSLTRFSLAVNRDIQYSFDEGPYYVQTGFTGTVTQRITGRWDLQVFGGRDGLAYTVIRLPDGSERHDRIDRIGGGIGYQFGETSRISFDVQSYQRQSQLPDRDYKTLRAGLSVSYGY